MAEAPSSLFSHGTSDVQPTATTPLCSHVLNQKSEISPCAKHVSVTTALRTNPIFLDKIVYLPSQYTTLIVNVESWN